MKCVSQAKAKSKSLREAIDGDMEKYEASFTWECKRLNRNCNFYSLGMCREYENEVGRRAYLIGSFHAKLRIGQYLRTLCAR